MGVFRLKPAPVDVPDPGPVVVPFEVVTATTGDTDVVVNPETTAIDPWPTMGTAEPEPEPEAVWPEGEYRGRLVTDGNGNLLADEGDWAGHGVYHNPDAGLYEFVEPDGLSHNQRHHKRVAEIAPTTAGNPDLGVPGDPHHNQPTDKDSHYAPLGGAWHHKRGWSFTQTKSDPDEIAPLVTGHTDAYRGRTA